MNKELGKDGNRLKIIWQLNLPVTIKYPEMVVQIAPHFDGVEIPAFGKDNLWSL